MKKIAFITIILTIALLSYLMQADWGSEKFTDTLAVDPGNITKLKLSMPDDSNYTTTTDSEKIEEFMQYFKSKDYKRIRGDEPAELPMSASMIYLYENEKTDFLVVFGDKVLISYKYYEIKGDMIDMAFLREFQQSAK